MVQQVKEWLVLVEGRKSREHYLMCPHSPLQVGREEGKVENFTWLALLSLLSFM